VDVDGSSHIESLLGVGQNVVKRPIQKILVTQNPEILLEILLQADSAPSELSFHKGQNLIDDQFELDGILSWLARTGVIEEIIHSLGKTHGLVVNRLQETHRPLVHLVGPPLQQLGRGAYDTQRITNLVGDAGHHSAHAHQPLSTLYFFFKLPVLLHALGQHTLRPVNDDEEKSEKNGRGQQTHDHDDALKDQDLDIVRRDVLGQLKHTQHGRLTAYTVAVSPQGKQHAKLKYSGIEGQSERDLPERKLAVDHRLGRDAAQDFFKPKRRDSLFAYFSGISRIGHHVREIIDAQPVHGQPLDNRLHHGIEALILLLLTQGYAPVFQDGRHSETLKNLVIQIFGEQSRELLLPLHKGLPGRVGNEEGERQTGQENHGQRTPGKRTRITERQPPFGFIHSFFRGADRGFCIPGIRLSETFHSFLPGPYGTELEVLLLFRLLQELIEGLLVGLETGLAETGVGQMLAKFNGRLIQGINPHEPPGEHGRGFKKHHQAAAG